MDKMAQWDIAADEPPVVEVLRSGVWSRAKVVEQFEVTWAKTIGAKACVTTVNGTNALICALASLDIGGGDEVIIPPYTFIATPQAVLQAGAMSVFVDTDPQTFQMDVSQTEAKITPRTRASACSSGLLNTYREEEQLNFPCRSRIFKESY